MHTKQCLDKNREGQLTNLKVNITDNTASQAKSLPVAHASGTSTLSSMQAASGTTGMVNHSLNIVSLNVYYIFIHINLNLSSENTIGASKH